MEPITIHELRTILGNKSYDAGLAILSKGEASLPEDISDITKIVMIGNKKRIAVVIRDREGVFPYAECDCKDKRNGCKHCAAALMSYMHGTRGIKETDEDIQAYIRYIESIGKDPYHSDDVEWKGTDDGAICKCLNDRIKIIMATIEEVSGTDEQKMEYIQLLWRSIEGYEYPYSEWTHEFLCDLVDKDLFDIFPVNYSD